jgi:hypothetical protein
MSPIQPCMGGGCSKRQACRNYHAATPDQQPAERLCEKGRDGVALEYQVVVHHRTAKETQHA